MSEREARNMAFRRLLERLEKHNSARRGHGERVASFAVAVGYEMDLRDESLYNLRWAGALHDVWKLEVATEILERPMPLDSEVLSALRNGPAVFEAEGGLDLLEQISGFIGKQYCWWNGEGTPAGVRGNDIPLESRIIAVCSAFDTMTSDQPWRAAGTEEASIEELRANAGSQFDPDVVNSFLKVQPLVQPVRNV